MIVPPFSGGMAFTDAGDGDIRGDLDARRQVSRKCQIPDQWATVRQVHGLNVHRIEQAGPAGEGDGLWTTTTDVPVAMFTADCFGVILQADKAVGVAHAGWRGVRAGVIAELRSAMTDGGHPPLRAAVGPGIGACCFEVGRDVADRFPDLISETSWGSQSVDLRSAIGGQLTGLDTWISDDCTRHDPGWFSHRANATKARLAAIGWL